MTASARARSVVEPARASASMTPHLTGELEAARLTDFTHDENLLAAVLLHGHANLRILQVSLGQARPHVVLNGLEPQTAGVQPADQRKCERTVGPHDVLAGELRLVHDHDREDIVRADDVVGRSRLLGDAQGRCEQHQDNTRDGPQAFGGRSAAVGH